MDGPVADAYVAASEFFVDVVGRVPEHSWALPGLGEWSVRELVGHANRAHTLLYEYIERPQPPEPPGSAYFSAEAIAARGRESVSVLGEDVVAAVTIDAGVAVDVVVRSAPDTVVGSPMGTTTLADYLPSRAAELTIHGLDLARALSVDVAPQPAALAASLGFVAGRAVTRSGADVLLALTGRGVLPPGYSVY